MNTQTTFLMISFFVVIFIGVILYFRPKLLSEGFATVAIEQTTLPKCFLRDSDAQALVEQLSEKVRGLPPASEKAVAFEEFKLILQKLLCVDADVTGAGMGPFTTYALPFVTAHDIEPVASFVGRCLRNAVRSEDIEIMIDKLERRGNELLSILCDDKSMITRFHTVVARASRNISEYCLKEKHSIDKPAGPRDPGYYVPPELETHREYTISGNGVQYI
jgi:hypothetical protein